jgi:hypothetical protein
MEGIIAFPPLTYPVILSAVAAARSAAVTESKDPLKDIHNQQRRKAFSQHTKKENFPTHSAGIR